MTTTHRLDWADIQGNILRGYSLAVARHCFYRVTNATRARELLASLLPEVTTAEDERQDGAKWSDGSKPHSTLNIAMTYAGLAALGVPEPALFAFPPEFRVGMRARAKVLVDRGPSAPENWDALWREDPVHLVLLINAPNQRTLNERYDVLRARIDESDSVTLAGIQDAAMRLVDGRMQEHFGFIDGFGNPDVDGAPGRTRPGRGKLLPTGNGPRWRLANSCSDRGMRRAKPRRRRSRRCSFATARSWCIASCTRTSPPFGATCETRASVSVFRPTSSGRRWSDGGPTARRSSSRRIIPIPRSWKIPIGIRASSTRTIRKARAARWARTFVARTRGTRSASAGCS